MNQAVLQAKHFAIISVAVLMLMALMWQAVATQAQTPTANASITGTIKAVDAAAGTITITGSTGADTVLTVSSQTDITANNCESNLGFAAANIGASVTASFDSASNAASSISINGTAVTCVATVTPTPANGSTAMPTAISATTYANRQRSNGNTSHRRFYHRHTKCFRHSLANS